MPAAKLKTPDEIRDRIDCLESDLRRAHDTVDDAQAEIDGLRGELDALCGPVGIEALAPTIERLIAEIRRTPRDEALVQSLTDVLEEKLRFEQERAA